MSLLLDSLHVIIAFTPPITSLMSSEATLLAGDTLIHKLSVWTKYWNHIFELAAKAGEDASGKKLEKAFEAILLLGLSGPTIHMIPGAVVTCNSLFPL